MVEIDPDQIVSAVRRLIHELLPFTPNGAGLIMCGQMGGLVLTTDAGAPLSNYISWRDQRLLQTVAGGDTYFDLLIQRLSPVERRQLGNEVRPGLPLSFLFWLSEQKQLPASGAIAATLTDFVLAHLCGSTPGLELTQATGALNLETLDWHYGALAKLGLEQVRWPNLRDMREPVGRLEAGGRSLLCYAPLGDHQCALAGAGLGPRELSLNISTGSQASLLTPKLELGNYQTRPFFDGRFLNTITHIPAGRSLNVLLGLLGELAEAQHVRLEDPWSYIQQVTSAIPDTDLTVDLAFFPGPAGERGAIANIHEGNLKVADLFYAAFRNMVDNYQACAARLSPNRDWQTLVFSGGLAQKLSRLRQMIVARFDCDYRLCASTDEALLGLLALGLVVSGRAPSVAVAVADLRSLERQPA
jgi:sugar (pentulose or hexulose) kinase